MEVVGDDPQVEGPLVAGVAADAPDEHLIPAGGLDRHRVGGGAGVVEDDDAGGRREQLPSALRGELLARLHIDGLGVPRHNGYPNAGRAHPDRSIAEDLAGLVDELALLVGVIVSRREAAGVGEDVECDLVGVLLRRRDAPVVEQRMRLVEQLIDGPPAGAGNGLVGGDHEPLDAGRVLQRLERHDHLHRRAVRVGNDAAVARQGIGVDLADDERHVLLHAPARGVVDHHGARGGEPRRPLTGGRAAGREEGDVEAPDRLLVQALNGEAAVELPPDGALGGEWHDLLGGKAPLPQQPQHQSADLTGRADHGDSVAAPHGVRVTAEGPGAGAAAPSAAARRSTA